MCYLKDGFVNQKKIRRNFMKKIISFCLIVLAMLSLMLLSGCNTNEAHTHAFGEWKTIKEATCTEGGQRARNCSCGESEAEVIPATGHIYKYTETVDGGGNASATLVCQGAGCDSFLTETAGLYNAEEILLASWDELVNVYGLDIEKDYDSRDSINEKSHLTYIHQNYKELTEGTKLIIPNGVEKIGDFSFYSCDLLEIVELPNSVKNIGAWAFSDCGVDIYYNGTSEEWEKVDHGITFISLNTTIHYDEKIEFLAAGFVGYWGSSGMAGILKKIVVDGENIYINGVLYEANLFDDFEITYPTWFKSSPAYGYEEERLEVLEKIKLCKNWYVLEKVELVNSQIKIAVCYLDNTHYFIPFIEENGQFVAESVFRTLIGG